MSFALFNDALSVVCTFLDLRSLFAAYSSCRRWSTAILQQRCFKATDVAALAAASPSPLLRRHLGSLSAAVSVADFVLITERLPNLTDLAVKFVQLHPEKSQLLWSFPYALRRLQIQRFTPKGSEWPLAMIDALIAGIAHATQLRSLKLEFKSQCDLQPLASLPHLTEFTAPQHFTDTQAEMLRSFPSVLRLEVQTGRKCKAAKNSLDLLTRTPHLLQLQSINIGFEWDDEVAALVTRVPTLTEANLGYTGCSHLDFLHVFPLLQSLTVRLLDRGVHAVRIEEEHLIATLTSLQKLTHLEVGKSELNCAQWTRILQALPALASLIMDMPSSLESLRCFKDAGPALAASLTRLCLYQLENEHLTPAGFQHLRPLQRLTYLSLQYTQPELLDTKVRQTLTPPSPWCPLLAESVLPHPDGSADG